MDVLSLCDETPGGIPPEFSVAEAVSVMLHYQVGAMAVVDDQDVVAGVFSERDLMTKVALSGRDPATIPVAEVMARPVFLATRETTPGQALAAMIHGHVRHLPVVDDDGRLLGMLPLRHLLEARLEELQAALDAPDRGSAAGAA